MILQIVYCILLSLVRCGMFFYHPVFRLKGRENIPADGSYLICCNHSGMADPIWLLFALRWRLPHIMAKKEVMEIPVLGWLLKKFGVFGVDRGTADVNAIKTAMHHLRNGEQLMIFPEGTRVKSSNRPQPKSGAVMLAHRTQSPILPVYLTAKRHPFSAMTCIIGEPYLPEFADKKPTEEQLRMASQKMMDKIYEMGKTL